MSGSKIHSSGCFGESMYRHSILSFLTLVCLTRYRCSTGGRNEKEPGANSATTDAGKGIPPGAKPPVSGAAAGGGGARTAEEDEDGGCEVWSQLTMNLMCMCNPYDSSGLRVSALQSTDIVIYRYGKGPCTHEQTRPILSFYCTSFFFFFAFRWKNNTTK